MSEKIGKILFWVFLVIGIVFFILMLFILNNHLLVMFFNIDKSSLEFLPSLFILLSSLIAAFSVNRTVINTREMKKQDILREKNRNSKILEVGKKFLLEELKTQEEFFNSLKQEINEKTEHLIDLDSSKYFYSDKTNDDKIINQIDYLLKIELHSYSKEDTLASIFQVKNDVIFIIHYVNVLKSDYIKNNKRQDALMVIEAIFELLDEINTNISTNFRM